MPKNVTTSTDGRIRVRVTRWIHGRRREREKLLPKGSTETVIARTRADLLEQLDELERLGDATQAPERTTVRDYSERWLEQRVRSCKPSTLEKEVAVLVDFILPSIGTLRPNQVNRYAIVEMMQHWTELTNRNGELYAGSSLRTYWRITRQFLRDLASDFGLTDPTERIKPPSRVTQPRRERQTLTTDEIGDLLRWIEIHRPNWYAEVYTLACTGLRAGELYALRWADVDLDRAVITIQRAHYRGEVGSTKTGSVRTVAIPASLVASLRPLRKSDRSLVFPSARGTCRHPSAVAKLLAAAADGCGISGVRMGAQVLRRSLNSRLLEQGVDRAVVQSQMGHVTDRMTDTYAEIHAGPKRAAVGAFDEALKAQPHRAVVGSGGGVASNIVYLRPVYESEF